MLKEITGDRLWRRSSNRGRVLRLTRLVIAGGLLTGLLASVGYQPIVRAFEDLAWWWIPVLLGIRLLALYVQSQRWRLFLAHHRIRVSNARLFKSCWIARFFNNFLPGQLGGDAYRVLHGLDPAVNRAPIASSVLVERIAGLIGLTCIVAAGGYASLPLMLTAGLGWLPVAATAAAAGLFALAASTTLPIRVARLAPALPAARLGSMVRRLAEALLVHVRHRRTLVLGIVVSAGFYTLMACESFLALRAFGIDIDFIGVLVVAPTIALVMSLPVTFNGWGTAEVASVFLYMQLGVTEADALSMALLGRANFLLIGGMGGLLYLWQSWQERIGLPAYSG